MGRLRNWTRTQLSKVREALKSRAEPETASAGAFFAAAYGVNIDGSPIVDARGEWVSKSSNEAVRECIGHIGKDSRSWDDYPGIEVQKDSVVWPVQWGKKCATAQDADIESRMMRDHYLGYEPPDMRRPSAAEVKKAASQTEQLGTKVHTQAYKQYGREYAREHLQHGRGGAAEKYGGQGRGEAMKAKGLKQ
jgi:hypothetical protein